MPTSVNEAAKIVEISRNYLTKEQMKELFTRLNNEVGIYTENSSLKISLQMMHDLVNPKPVPPEWWVKPLFYTTIALHAILVVAMVASFIALPFSVDWYVALPLMAFIFFFATNRVTCKITDLENYLRKKLSLPQISGFVGHYFIRPVKEFLTIGW